MREKRRRIRVAGAFLGGNSGLMPTDPFIFFRIMCILFAIVFLNACGSDGDGSTGGDDDNSTNVNAAPSITGTPPSATEDIVYTFMPTATDADLDSGDVLSFSINKVMATDIPWAAFTLETGLLAGTPANSDVGITNDIVITVTDSSGESAQLASFNLTVANEALVISGTPITAVAEDNPYSFTPTVLDQEDIESFSIANQPSWATFNTSTGLLTGTPVNADVGTDTDIRISVTDGHETSDLAPFEISIFDVNDPPVISGNPPSGILKNTVFSFTPSVTDIDSDPNPDILTYSIINQPAWNGVSFNTVTGELSATPDDSDVGPYDDIGITVSDGLASDTLTFSISVVEGERVLVTWTPPSTRVNGQPITTADLAGYQLEYYEEATPGDRTTISYDELTNSRTSYETEFLRSGTWHFAIRAIEITGYGGDLSPEVTAVSDGFPG